VKVPREFDLTATIPFLAL